MEESNSIPFENASLPFMSRLGSTVGLAFSNPMRLFAQIPGGDLGRPLLYGVITGTVATLFGLTWNMFFGFLGILAEEGDAAELVLSTGMTGLFMVLSPLLVAVGLFIHTAIYHIGLLLTGGAKRGFEVTFRAMAYGNTPALLFMLPLCGGVIGGLWAMVLVMIAGKLGHETDWWRAILGYFLPSILCCCLLGWLAGAAGLLGGLAGLVGR